MRPASNSEDAARTQRGRAALRRAGLLALLALACTIPLPRSCAGPDHCENCAALAETPAAEAPALGPVLLEVHFLDVGYGSAILLKTPEGAALVDAGPADRAEGTLAALRERGVERLDWALLTHFHPDHSGGFPAILAALPCGRLYLNQDPARARAEYDDYDDRLVETKAAYTVVKAGDAPPALGAARARVLAPSEALAGKDDNSRSVVLRVTAGGAALLLLGDATTLTDAYLLEAARDALPADALQIAHHGWGPGNTEALLRAAAPRVAVLSVGPSRWPAPEEAVLARFRGVPMPRTDVHGAVLVRTDGRTVEVSAERGWETRRLPARGAAVR